MPRIPDKNINYAEIGRLVLDYWSGRKGKADFEGAIRQKVSAAYAAAKEEAPAVKVNFEGPDELVINVPHNPWENETDKFKCAEDMSSYQNELGIVIFGGCR